jgi:hypothetical protein
VACLKKYRVIVTANKKFMEILFQIIRKARRHSKPRIPEIHLEGCKSQNIFALVKSGVF